jgi:hypothetical protein
MKNNLAGRGVRSRGFGLAAALLIATLLPACNDTTTNLPDIPRSIIVVTVEPSPVIGLQNILTGAVSAAYVVKIEERAGLGGTVQFVKGTIFDPESGFQVAVTFYDSSDLKVFVGSDRIDPQSTLDVTQTASYILSDYRVSAELSVSVQILDDQGTLINQSILVPIVPPES